jgi:hypothetical protein
MLMINCAKENQNYTWCGDIFLDIWLYGKLDTSDVTLNLKTKTLVPHDT